MPDAQRPPDHPALVHHKSITTATTAVAPAVLSRLLIPVTRAAANVAGISRGHGQIVWPTPALIRQIGYELGEVIERILRLPKVRHNTAAFHRDLWQTITARVVSHADEIEDRRPDKTPRTEQMTSMPVTDAIESSNHTIAIRQRITEHTAAEAGFANARHRAIEAFRHQSRFLVNMRYASRTPLDGIIGMMGLLLKQQRRPEARDRAETLPLPTGGQTERGIVDKIPGHLKQDRQTWAARASFYAAQLY